MRPWGTRRAARGAATVELALSMLLIVPIFLYVLFLDDLLRYKLDLQENVITTPWDLTTVNYEAGDRMGDVQHFNRLQFCDHISAYDSFDQAFECTGEQHHKAVSAHMCFLVGGKGEQVTCQGPQRDVGGNYMIDLGIVGALKDEAQAGGFYNCRARAGVINYFLPNKIWTSFSDVDMTGVAYHYGDIDREGTGTHASENASGNVFPLKEQRFGLIADTWALTSRDDLDTTSGGRSGNLYTRVDKIYGAGPLGSIATTMLPMAFVAQAAGQGLLNPMVMFDMGRFGDSTQTPEVTFTTALPPEQNGYYSSQWKDWEQDKVESSHSNRDRYYLGASGPPQ